MKYAEGIRSTGGRCSGVESMGQRFSSSPRAPTGAQLSALHITKRLRGVSALRSVNSVRRKPSHQD